MPNYVCIDETCNHYGKIENTPRRFFYGHIVKKPHTLLESLAEKYGIVPEPWRENKWTLVNAIVDYCHEITIKYSDERELE